MNHLLCLLISCLLVVLQFAGPSAASICDDRETVLFYGNGVNSIKKDAYASLEVIKERLQNALPTEEFDILAFDIAYNDTHGLPLDLLESSLQLLSGNTSRFWRFLWGLEIMPDWFAEKMILLAAALDKSSLVTTDSLKAHVNTYRTKIAEGKKVLLVAHSQGNLFGNEAYSLLNSREKSSFGMVSVANVDNSVLGSAGPYTTLKNDKVILALIAAQLALPTKPMEPNTMNQEAPADPLAHSFLQAYMVAGSNSDSRITGDILAILGSLAKPLQVIEPGVITVSLTWGSEPDIDLHVYEPNGIQVFWYNLQGYSGALDRDDRSGFGPEHYNVPTCEALEPGVYHVALDYYRGDGPEVATLQIEAGLLVRTYEIPMESEDYGSTDYPRMAANILVKNGVDGGYDFEIYR